VIRHLQLVVQLEASAVRTAHIAVLRVSLSATFSFHRSNFAQFINSLIATDCLSTVDASGLCADSSWVSLKLGGSDPLDGSSAICCASGWTPTASTAGGDEGYCMPPSNGSNFCPTDTTTSSGLRTGGSASTSLGSTGIFIL
jgi:hypothetical protein